MELKTLQDWDAKPGDVFGRGTMSFTIDRLDGEDAIGKTKYRGGMIKFGDNWMLEGTKSWHLISRATPTVDLTAITTPFGLLDADTKKALREYTGQIEVWIVDGWTTSVYPAWVGSLAYRARSTPTVKTFTQRVWLYDLQCQATITGQVQDGKLVGDVEIVVD